MHASAQLHNAVKALIQVSEHVRIRRASLARSVHLTEIQWRVLESIENRQFIPSLFADTQESSRPAVSRVLRQLSEKKWIKAQLSPHNGRHRHYELTAAGQRILEKVQQKRMHALETIWHGLEPSELDTFTRICQKLSEGMRSYAEEQEK